jgi:large subunit ribosomal protein L15
MKLNEVKPVKGAVKPAWRRGQGPGSGNGKTAGRGHKGQHSRSGSKHRRSFEGGQMPLHRRTPKRGFHNLFRKEYAIANLDTLDRTFAAGAVVTLEEARKQGLIRGELVLFKILGDGEIKKPLVVHAHKASAKAREKIEAAGGRVELVVPVAKTA